MPIAVRAVSVEDYAIWVKAAFEEYAGGARALDVASVE